VNKFFTIVRGVLLVYLMEGIGFGEMSPVLPIAVAEVPPSTEPRAGLPKALELSRYTALGKKSPFTLASATAEAAFAKDLVLGGYVRLEGEDYVMVANKTKPDRILVGRKPSPSAQGMILLDLKKDPLGDPSKMKAKIQKGSEMAELQYEMTGGGATPTGQAPTAMQAQPPIPGLPAQAQVNPGAKAANAGGQAPGMVIRRRVIPIPPGGKK
jgi:hypothetical protein